MKFIGLLLCCLFSVGHGAESTVPSQWDKAGWIGFTDDHRPAELAERTLLYAKIPADSSTIDPSAKPRQARAFPAPLLRTTFEVNKTLRTAQVQVCGLGLYELYLNGQKVGDRVLDPAQTTYDKRAFYVLHDVTKLISRGRNCLGLMLGSGFYGQNTGLGGGGLSYGAPRAKLLLTLEFTDGTTQFVSTGKSWKATQGPVFFDNIYAGETYDARSEIADWCRADCADATWLPAPNMAAPTANLLEQKLEPMRKIRSLQPISVFPAENGEWILDMGQNMTGWLHLRAQEPRGTKIIMRFAELLMPDGKAIDTASTGIDFTGGDQTDIYVCKGGGIEEWEPRFTYHGFRFVQIRGLSHRPDPQDFTGWLVRTDVARVGSFSCSDPLINKFYQVSMWTIEDNLQGLLSDCPHRERCAWMGDNHAVGEAASYNFDLRKFWPKVSADIATVVGANRPTGKIKNAAPYDARAPTMIAVGKRLCGQATVDWGAAIVLVPWFNYLYYGDLDTVQTAWPMMADWLAMLEESEVKNGLIASGLGDWCPPGTNSRVDTPKEITSTAIYYRSLESMRIMASALGKAADAEHYANQAATVKKAFIAKFYQPSAHNFKSQTATAMALHLGLIPVGEESQIAAGLASLIMEKSGGHYSTGIFGHRPLYTVLNDYGQGAVTSHLWSITDWPSLGFLTEKHNLTTWPEVPYNWISGKRYLRNSFNHPMHSGFAATFHESLGGIRPDPAGAGFTHFFLRPCFLPGLQWAKVEHISPRGSIASNWERVDEKVVWNVTVPNNSTALVQLPEFSATKISLDGKPTTRNEFTLEQGSWSIRIDP